MCRYGWKCQTLNIKTVYLQGNSLKKIVYIRSPKEAKTDKIWTLRKPVFGLKDAVKVWYNKAVKIMKELVGKRCSLDSTLFI